MKRKLYIHVGPSKTGTSAIQKFFRDEEVNSILYPKTGQWPDGSHHKICFSFHEKKQYGPINIPAWEKVLSNLREELSSSSQNVLISTEAATLPFVRLLMSELADYNFDIILIMVARNALERAASAYNQSVKDAVIGTSEEADNYLLGQSKAFRFKPYYENWKSLNLPIHVLPFKGEKPLVERFCHSVGVDYYHTIEEKKVNTSMSGVALLALLIANRLLNNEEQKRNFFTQLRNNKRIAIWKGASFPFSPDACAEFDKIIKPDVIWLSDTFGFLEDDFNSTKKKAFVLSESDTALIYTELEEANLVEGNEQLISSILSPYRS